MDAHQLSGVVQARELVPRVFHGALPYIPERGHDRVGKKDPPYDETYVLPESLFLAYELTQDHAFYERAMAYLLDRDYFDPLAAGETCCRDGTHTATSSRLVQPAKRAWFWTTKSICAPCKTQRNSSNPRSSSPPVAGGRTRPSSSRTKANSTQACARPMIILRRPAAVTRPSNWRAICSAPPAMRGMATDWSASSSTAFSRSKSPMPRAIIRTTPPMERRRTRFFIQKKWPCCSGTLVEGVADYVKNIYFRAHDGVAVNLYAPSRVKWTEHGTAVTLTQETDYPLRGTVTLRVASTAPIEFALRMRVPAWMAATPQLRVNGKPLPYGSAAGICRVCDGVGRAAMRSLSNFHCNFAPKPSTICILKPLRCYVGRLSMWKRIRRTLKPRTQSLNLCAPRPKCPEFSSSHIGDRTRTYAPFYFGARRSLHDVRPKWIRQAQVKIAFTRAIGSRRHFRSMMQQPSWRANSPREPSCAFPAKPTNSANATPRAWRRSRNWARSMRRRSPVPASRKSTPAPWCAAPPKSRFPGPSKTWGRRFPTCSPLSPEISSN